MQHTYAVAVKDLAQAHQSGVQPIVKMRELGSRIEELEMLLLRLQDAKTIYNNAVNSAAEKSGVHASVINKFIRARAGDRLREERTKAEQLQLCFEELPPGMA